MQINLVPEAQEEKTRVRKFNAYALLFSVGLIVATVAGFILLGSFYYVQKGINTANAKKIEKTKTEIAKYKDIEDLIVSIQKGLDASALILKQEGDVTNLLTSLENATPAEVKFKTLTINDASIEGTLDAKSVDALGKMERGIKGYTVAFLSGAGKSGESVKVNNGDKETTETVKVDGRWFAAVRVDPSKDFKITVTDAQGKVSTVTYTVQGNKLTTEGGIQTSVRNLFTVPTISSYDNTGNGAVSFAIKFNFDKEILW